MSGNTLGASNVSGGFAAFGADDGVAAGAADDVRVVVEHLAAEVAGVELDSPRGLVHAAQVAHRELGSYERGRERRVLELRAGRIDGGFENRAMVERELALGSAGEDLVDGSEHDGAGVGAGG